jgi:hypothetical protein
MICNKAAWDAVTAFVKPLYDAGRRWKDGDQEMGYPMYIPGECEYYGFNECGGMKPSERLNAENDEWVDHCYGYKDKDGPLGTVEWES